MQVLNQKEEELLQIILNKYDGNEEMQVEGSMEEIPEKIKFGFKDNFNKLKLCGYIGDYELYLYEWIVSLNQEGLEYFEKKGMRKELFEELSDNERELLKDIIDSEKRGENISEMLAKRVNFDSKDIVRGIIGTLKQNELLNVMWASDTVYNASLTNAGRTYFEREKKYLDRIKLNKSKTYHIENVNVDGGNFIVGDVNNSILNIDNHVTKIEEEIEEKTDEKDKENLKEILEETKEILDNIKNSGVIGQRKSFFNKLTKHACKYGWFYAEIVNLIGTAIIKK